MNVTMALRIISAMKYKRENKIRDMDFPTVNRLRYFVAEIGLYTC